MDFISYRSSRLASLRVSSQKKPFFHQPNPNQTKMPNTPQLFPETVNVLQSVGPLKSEKTGTEFYLVQAETPNPIPGGWSSIRWNAISAKPVPPGTSVPLASRVREIKFDRGEGSFRV